MDIAAVVWYSNQFRFSLYQALDCFFENSNLYLSAYFLDIADAFTDPCMGTGITITNSTGTISSPGYPNLYTSGLSCKWRIVVAPAEVST